VKKAECRRFSLSSSIPEHVETISFPVSISIGIDPQRVGEDLNDSYIVMKVVWGRESRRRRPRERVRKSIRGGRESRGGRNTQGEAEKLGGGKESWGRQKEYRGMRKYM
jgi:hypothetical protein